MSEIDPTIDYYKALGVTPKATADEIKKAYRKLAKQSHPDSTGGDKRKEARFKEVSAAYDVLGDAQKRAQYDGVRSLGGGRPRTGSGGGAAGAGGTSPVWDLGDLFSQMFTGGAPPSGGRRGVRFERGDDDWSPQPAPAPTETKLAAPDGSTLIVRGGDVHSDLRIGFDRAILGTAAAVSTAAGSVSVKIPPGTSSGKKLRLRGKGVVANGRGPGDHYVTVHIDVPAALDDEGQRLLAALTAHLAGKPPP